jgi:hypothetical protein
MALVLASVGHLFERIQFFLCATKPASSSEAHVGCDTHSSDQNCTSSSAILAQARCSSLSAYPSLDLSGPLKCPLGQLVDEGLLGRVEETGWLASGMTG